MIKQPKSLQLRRRYLLVSGSKDEIVSLLLDSLGTLGYSKAKPMFVETEKGLILAVCREALNEVRASFELSNSKAKIIRVSGTLKGV